MNDTEDRKECMIGDTITTCCRGPMKWPLLFTLASYIVFGVIAVIAALRLFAAEQVREMILYATIFLASFAVLCVAKLWFWIMASRHAIQRDLKRLERRLDEMGRCRSVEALGTCEFGPAAQASTKTNPQDALAASSFRLAADPPNNYDLRTGLR